MLSHVRLFAIPWTVAYRPPQFMEFSRQEYWSGLPFPSPWDLPDPGIEPGSPALRADTLPSEPPGKSIALQTTFEKRPIESGFQTDGKTFSSSHNKMKHKLNVHWDIIFHLSDWEQSQTFTVYCWQDCRETGTPETENRLLLEMQSGKHQPSKGTVQVSN